MIGKRSRVLAVHDGACAPHLSNTVQTEGVGAASVLCMPCIDILQHSHGFDIGRLIGQCSLLALGPGLLMAGLTA